MACAVAVLVLVGPVLWTAPTEAARLHLRAYLFALALDWPEYALVRGAIGLLGRRDGASFAIAGLGNAAIILLILAVQARMTGVQPSQ